MKDKEWLKNEITSMFTSAYELGKIEYYESEQTIERLSELIDQLDEPEVPVIPQFVADWIDEFSLQGSNPLKVYEELSKDFSEGWTTDEDARVYHWISRNSKNTDCFIDSLRYGYEIERND